MRLSLKMRKMISRQESPAPDGRHAALLYSQVESGQSVSREELSRS